MPLGIPNPTPAMAPPPPATGAIAPPIITGGVPSAPLNIGMGMGAAAASNAAIGNQFGTDVTAVALLTNLIMQFAKTFKWVDQHRWFPVMLLVIAIGAFLLLTQGDIFTSIKQGAVSAFQAATNYHALKIAGVNALPSTPDVALREPSPHEDTL